MYKLLIVEDEKPLREKMVKNVDWEKHGYQLYQASNGKEALKLIEKEDIDILVTDIKMPEVDGIELIEKAQDILDKIKMIIISGYAEFEYAQQSIRLGVSDYLLKPFRSKHLLEVVNNTREKMCQEEERNRELNKLRNEITEYVSKREQSEVLYWLRDGEFIEKQSMMMEENSIYQVLKTGSKQELYTKIEEITKELDSLSSDKNRFYIYLNNIILFTYKVVKELGYDFSELMEIALKSNLDKLGNNSGENKKRLKKFLLEVNQLISTGDDDRTSELIKKIREYIDHNFDQGITLNELAKKFNISNSYLSNLFSEHVESNFTDYLNKVRVNKAKELLKTSDKKIYQIADKVGFNDSGYFSSWFKKIVGVSPSVYRDNLDLL